MCRLFHITLLLFISFLGYAQKDKNEFVFIDSIGNKVESNKSFFVFELNNNIDSIKLEHLYDNAFTKAASINYFQDFSTNSIDQDSSLNSEVTSLGYCVECLKDELKIIDAIDLKFRWDKGNILTPKMDLFRSTTRFSSIWCGFSSADI